MQVIRNPVVNQAVVLVPETPGIQDYVLDVVPTVVPKKRCSGPMVTGILIALSGVIIGVAAGVTFGVYYRGC